MTPCGAEGLSATTQITAPQQPHKHTPHEERRTAKSPSLQPPLNTLLYTYSCIMFWILLPGNIMLLKLLLSSLGEKPMITQQFKAFLSHFRTIWNHFFKLRRYCANGSTKHKTQSLLFSFSISILTAGLWFSKYRVPIQYQCIWKETRFLLLTGLYILLTLYGRDMIKENNCHATFFYYYLFWQKKRTKKNKKRTNTVVSSATAILGINNSLKNCLLAALHFEGQMLTAIVLPPSV